MNTFKFQPRPAGYVRLIGIACGLALALTMLGTAFEAGGGDQATKPWKAPSRAARKKNPVPADTQSIQKGQGVYARECLSCHGEDGRGNGPKAAELDVPVIDLTDPAMWEQSDGAVYWKITKGRTPMPAYKKLLTDDERWHVVNYIRAFAPKTVVVTPPKFDVPERYRKALSGVFKPYVNMHAAIVKADLPVAQSHAQVFATALNELKQVKTDEFSSEIRTRWNDDVQAVSAKLEGLICSEDMELARQRLAGLSAALAEMIGRFGHVEKVPVRVFASKTEYRGKPAVWLQTEREPINGYGGPDLRREGTLMKLLGAQRRPHTEGGST